VIRAYVILSAWCSLLPAIACRPPEARSSSPERTSALEAAWQDAIPAAPDLLVSIRPKALRADGVYGPMLRRALELAREQRVTSGSLVLEAIEDADEVIAELGEWAPSAPAEGSGAQELLLVLRGTRGDIDPARLVGPEGDLLWSAGPSGAVRELVHERDHDGTPNPASLFELPDRTWVVASGAARDRARDAFAHPSHRPEPSFAPDAFATVRIDGASLVGRVSLLQSSGPLASVGRGLRSVDLDLLAPPAPLPVGAPSANRIPRREMRALVTYSNAQTAAAAGNSIRDMLQVVGRLKPAGLAWLEPGRVDLAGSSVAIIEPVPMDLLSGFLRAGRGAAAPR
jgi:hypothetical protein